MLLDLYYMMVSEYQSPRYSRGCFPVAGDASQAVRWLPLLAVVVVVAWAADEVADLVAGPGNTLSYVR